MKNFSTWLIVMFMVIFWLFRAIVALCTQFSIDLLGIVAYNLTWEIIISFLVLICMLLIAKRNLIGGLLYLGLYGVYFGEHLITNIINVSQGQALSIDVSMNILFDVVAIILAIFALLDILVDKSRKANPIDKKTDWYFKNEKYDEELKARDQREDQNEYKFY